MNENNCGCNDPDKNDKEYLLVKATASEASTCGVPGESSGTNCAKQEPMYDISLSDFLLPSEIGSTSMQVCNGNIYSVGMWIQFVDPVTTLQISNITNNILMLVNKCQDGSIITSNPDVGRIIYRNTRFIVSDAPDCSNDEDFLQKINDALEGVTEICVPNLGQCSDTAIIQPVGRVSSDPSNLGAGRCMKRIFGFLFKGGTPILSALKFVAGSDAGLYRRIVKHKTTNEIKNLANYSEYPSVLPNRQYFLGVTKEGEKLLGPAYVTHPFHITIAENTSSQVVNDWPNLDLTHEQDFDLGSIGQIDGLTSNLDHYYAMVRIDVGVRSELDNIVRVKTNNTQLGRVYSAKSTSEYNIQFNTMSCPIKVMKSDNKLSLHIRANETSKFYFRLTIDGIHF